MILTSKAKLLFKYLLEKEIEELEQFISKFAHVKECEDDVADASNDLGFAKAVLKGLDSGV